MFIFKLGLLTCAFYMVLTILLEAGLWAVAYFKGLGVVIDYRHPFWTLGIKLGAISGALWCISFSAAWYIVYLGLRARMPIISN
jgi:hypothetical protein